MVFPLLSLSLLVFAVPRAGYWCSTWNQKAGRALEAPQKPGVATTSADESDLTEGEGQELRLKTRAVVLPGAVLTVATYLGQYILTSAGNYVSSKPCYL